MDEHIKAIARDLGIDLAPRGQDDLDFHQVHVVGIRKALDAAYRAGYVARAGDVELARRPNAIHVEAFR